MRIHGEHLGEPTTVVVEDGWVKWASTVAPGLPLKKDRAAEITDFQIIALVQAPLHGLTWTHVFGPIFAIGAAFAHMPWLGIVMGGGITAHAGYRWTRPLQVLILATANERVEIVVEPKSVPEARAFVEAHGRAAAPLPTARASR
jgi:hypothetical protein